MHTPPQKLKNLQEPLPGPGQSHPVTELEAKLALKCEQVGSPSAYWDRLMQLWCVGSGDRWQCNILRHAMLPESQESREFCLPGGHPTWDEGTGAKEEKVSAG